MRGIVNHFYEFGPFHFDAARARLTRDGGIVSLTPKALEVLLVLIQSEGQLVEKDELMKTVWPDTFVEEGNLSVHVFALRKALGEDVDGQGYIETVPKQGYRFTSSVREVKPNGASLILEKHTRSLVTIEEHEESVEEKEFTVALPESQALARGALKRRRYTQAAVAAAFLLTLAVGSFIYFQRNPKQSTTAQLRTIAVLPFKPLSTGADDEYFRIGMADALIIKLGSLRQVVVRPTSAVLRYTDSNEGSQAIGRALGVDAVLEGYIQRDGERIRATARLVSVRDGAQLWAGRFDDSFTNVFAVQDSISAQVAHSLSPTLIENDEKQALAKRYTENTEAYLEYLKGRYFWNKRTATDAKKAIQHFEQAIGLDPNYALAYSGLADCYAIRTAVPPKIAIPKAMAAALKAVELDDGLAEGHVSLGTIKELYEWDRAGAEWEYKRALELNPNYALAHGFYSMYLTSMGRFDEGAAEAKRAQEIDPLSPSMYLYAGWNFYNARQYDRSIEEAQKAIDLEANVSMAYNIMVRAFAEKKMFKQAIEMGQRAQAISGQKRLLISKEHPISLASLGYAYAASGQSYEARQILNELKDLSTKAYVSPNHFAVIHAGLGEQDQALEYLERTYQERDEMQRFIKVSPIFDNLHSDPRFIDLLRRVGLPK